jgi:hypothetical protein
MLMTMRAIRAAAVLASCLAAPQGLRAQQLKPETVQGFDCYVHAAEARMQGRKQLLAPKLQTVLPNGPNPHSVPGGQVYDWIGAIFIPGVTLERTLRMMQDYDHRAQYFHEILSSAKLQCRSGDTHFGVTMQFKEPSIMETQNDVVWEKVDDSHWQCRSYSTAVREIGKSHGYVQRLYSYWRLAQANNGVYVEAQAITLSGEFSGIARALGSMMGINPEKSLKKSLEAIHETLLKKDLQFSSPPTGLPACGEPFHPPACHGN